MALLDVTSQLQMLDCKQALKLLQEQRGRDHVGEIMKRAHRNIRKRRVWMFPQDKLPSENTSLRLKVCFSSKKTDQPNDVLSTKA